MKCNSLHQSRCLQIWVHPLPLIVVLLLAGCANHQANTPAKATTTMSQPEPAPENGKWVVPSGWIALEPSRGFEIAAFAIPDVSGEGYVAVLRINDYDYGLLPNVNRWRSQIGLGPIETGSLSEISKPVETASGDCGKAFQIIGTENSILAAAFVRGETSWFFKLIAPNALAELQKDSFDVLIASFHL